MTSLLLHWLPVATTTGLVVNALRLRDRLSGLRRVRPADPREAAADYDFVTGEGVELSRPVRSAAVEFAARHGHQVLDLVPADLPVQRAMDFARSVDTRTYGTELSGPGCGAGHAAAVTHSVLGRMGVAAESMEAGDFAALTVRLKQYTVSAGMAVVPGPCAPLRSRRAWLRGLGRSLPLEAVKQLVAWALVVFGVVVSPVAGLVGVVVYSCVPYLVFTAGPLEPGDLNRAALRRMIDVPLSWLGVLLAKRTDWERRQAARVAEARAWYREELAKGVSRFVEERQSECPWCGSRDLELHLTARDIIHVKPGRFTLERCADCGHIFQNPRLTPEGLSFYYRDVYDGLGLEQAERVFAGQGKWYRARLDTVAAVTTPRTWLDVGTGHAHFCRTASGVLADCVFDGLDMGEGVLEAVRRGWLRHGYQGSFPELVDELAGRYDVISMHHYLEHTRDPFSELDAAMKVLGPGGHLLIEVPDPDSVFGRLLRGFWIPWLPPQHQHMFPLENLQRALTARGMEIVTVVTRKAQQSADLPGAVLVMLNLFGPEPGRPWAPHDPTVLDYLRRGIALVAAGPLLALAFGAQAVVWPFVRGHGNAYRILARKAAG